MSDSTPANATADTQGNREARNARHTAPSGAFRYAPGYIQFWVCPVAEHRNAGGASVRWEGDFAWCLTPGCRSTNARVPAPQHVDPPYVPSELLDRLTEAEGQILAQLGVSMETIVSYGGLWMEKVWPVLAAGLKAEQL